MGKQKKKWNKTLLKTAPLLVACGIMGTAFAETASAHGYIESPTSRSYMCKTGQNLNCGPVQYEPQSIEAQGTFPKLGPADGQIASGGIFKQLDVQTVDRWNKVTMKGGKNTFTWRLTAPHSTAEWKYYITKKDWNPNKPLTRADFEQIGYIHEGGKKPSSYESHEINVPTDRDGYHVILGVWEIADTPNAFYQVMDVNLINDGSITADKEAPTVPTSILSPGQTANSVELKWSASTDNVGVMKYEILRNGEVVGESGNAAYTDQGLQANTEYTYTIRAVDAAGNKSDESAAFKVTTKEVAAIDKEAPTVPSAFTGAEHEMHGVSLAWNASTDNVGVVKYEIVRDGKVIAETARTSYVDHSVQEDTEYKYAVRAVDAAGNKSALTGEVVVKTKSDSHLHVEQWNPTKVYVGGMIVEYKGLQYKANYWTVGNEPDKSDAWRLISNVVLAWENDKVYFGGDRVIFEGVIYEAKWWTRGETPGEIDVWKKVM